MTINRKLYGKYSVQYADGCTANDCFVLRLGDPHADKAIDTDPVLALELNAAFVVRRASEADDAPPLIGCVVLQFTVWSTPHEKRVRRMLIVYARSVAAESPAFADDLLRIAGSDTSVGDNERDDWTSYDARLRLAAMRAERLREREGT